MEITATTPIDPYANARRAYLRPFVMRSAWATVLAGVVGIFLLLFLFMALEPYDQVLAAVKDRRTLKTWLIVFWVFAGVTLLGTLVCGVVATARSGELFGPNAFNGANTLLTVMKAAQIVGGIALFVFIGALALPLRSVFDDSSYFDLAPNNTPAETIQFMLFVIAGAVAIMLLLNRRAMIEIRQTLLGDDAMRRRAAFEVLMPLAQLMPTPAFSTQPITAPASNTQPAAPTPPMMPPTPSPAPAVATPYPAMQGLAPMMGSSGDPAVSRSWERIVGALLLMIIGLSITHLWVIYAFRKEFKDTKAWERIYMEFSEVPQDPRLSTNNVNMNGRPYSYATTRYYGSRFGRYGPPLQKKNEPLAGFAALCVVGGSLAVLGLQAAAVLWAATCVATGARLRTLGLLTAWTMLIFIAITMLSHAYLIQQFKFAPEEAAMLSFFRTASSGEFREYMRLNSPTDMSIKQLAIPLAMILVLSGERVRRMWRGGRA